MRGWRLAHLPVLLTVSGVLLVLATGAGALLRGGAGGAGAAAGVGLVVVSYLASTVVIAWADSVDPQLILPLGLLTYVVKFSLIGVVMAAVAASGWTGLEPLGAGVIVGVLGWTTAQIWWVVHRPPRLEYHPPGGAERSGDPGC